MKRFVWPAAVLVVVLIAVVIRIQAFKAEAGEVKEGVDAIQRREGYPVEVVKVQQGSFEVWREIHGMLMSSHESHLRTGDPARIQSVNIKVGDQVKADAPLILLDPDDPKNLTRVKLAEQVYREAKRDYEKYKRLAASDAMAQNAVDKAKLQMEAAKTDLDLARSAVEISSSIDGLVTALDARVGERADKDRDLAVVSTIDPLRFTSSISDTDAAVIQTGQAAKVRTPEGGEEPGDVERVSLRAEPKNSLFDLEIKVANPQGSLKIGTYATAEVRIVNLTQADTIDYRCLFTDFDGRTYVYQVKDGKAVKTPVEVVAANQDAAAVKGESFDPTLPVVIRGKSLLRDGVKVLVEPDKTQASPEIDSGAETKPETEAPPESEGGE